MNFKKLYAKSALTVHRSVQTVKKTSCKHETATYIGSLSKKPVNNMEFQDGDHFSRWSPIIN